MEYGNHILYKKEFLISFWNNEVKNDLHILLNVLFWGKNFNIAFLSFDFILLLYLNLFSDYLCVFEKKTRLLGRRKENRSIFIQRTATVTNEHNIYLRVFTWSIYIHNCFSPKSLVSETLFIRRIIHPPHISCAQFVAALQETKLTPRAL